MNMNIISLIYTKDSEISFRKKKKEKRKRLHKQQHQYHLIMVYGHDQV